MKLFGIFLYFLKSVKQAEFDKQMGDSVETVKEQRLNGSGNRRGMSPNSRKNLEKGRNGNNLLINRRKTGIRPRWVNYYCAIFALWKGYGFFVFGGWQILIAYRIPASVFALWQ